MVILGLPSFEPIGNVTPFTYRDGDTYLTILKRLQDKVTESINAFNALSVENAAEHSAISTTLTAQFNDALTALRAELAEMIEGINGGATAFNPTSGSRTDNLSRVVGDVYDNLRIYGYFAKQYDDLGLTAAQYDALAHGARHFDLAVTYPTLNATRPIV